MTETNGDAPKRILDRVRKLLAQAESTDNEAEQESFNQRAAELMAKYGIERARLADVDPTSDKVITKMITMAEPYAELNGFFLINLAKAMRATGLLLSYPRGYRRGYDHVVKLFGYESDLERAEMVWTSLLVQQAGGLSRAHVPYYDSPRAYRRSWVLGFHAMAEARIKLYEQHAAEQAANETTSGGTGMELVLASRQELAKRALKEEHPDIKTVKRRSSGDGFHDGVEAARRADIGATRIDRSATRGLPRGGA